MVSIQGGSGGGGGFDYVQDPSPQSPEEGEEWYDTGSDRAFVYDGANWIEQTIGDHGQLSGVGASDHHTRPTGTKNGGGGRNVLTYSETVSGSSYSTYRYYPPANSSFMRWSSGGDSSTGFYIYVTLLGTEYTFGNDDMDGWARLPYGAVDEIRVRYNPNDVGDVSQTESFSIDVLEFQRDHAHGI